MASAHLVVSGSVTDTVAELPGSMATLLPLCFSPQRFFDNFFRNPSPTLLNFIGVFLRGRTVDGIVFSKFTNNENADSLPNEIPRFVDSRP